MGEIGETPSEAVQTIVKVKQPEVIKRGKTDKEILKRLNPEKLVDEEGNEREVYIFRSLQGHSVKVIFYSPEEIPFSKEIMEGKQGFIFGKRPKWRSEDWKGFISKVRASSEAGFSPINPLPSIRHEAIKAGKAIFFAESNPASLLDLAFVLGVEDKALREARGDAAKGIMTDETEKIIDQVIAAKALDDEGNLKEGKNYEGEVFLILSLIGDKDAQALLTERLRQLKEKDVVYYKENWLSEIRERAEKIDEEPLKLEELVAVHLTRHLPRRRGKNLEMITTFDATEGKLPRNTIHFALNHPVASHAYGSWEEVPYVVIAPLDKIIELNGRPTVLNTIDTFFEVSPGETLKLPKETWVVKPGEVEEGRLFQQQGDNEVVYKAPPFKPEDVKALTEMLTEYRQHYLNQLRRSIWGAVTEPTRFHAFWGEFKNAIITKEEYNRLVESLGGEIKPKNLLELFGKKDYREVISQIFKDAGIERKITEGVFENIVKEIERHLTSTIKKTAIAKQLKEMGYEVQRGGMWAWNGSSWTATRQTAKLGAELGVPVIAHTDHITSLIEREFMGTMFGPGLLTLIETGEITPKEYRERVNRFVIEKFPELSQKSRRMLYLLGAI